MRPIHFVLSFLLLLPSAVHAESSTIVPVVTVDDDCVNVESPGLSLTLCGTDLAYCTEMTDESGSYSVCEFIPNPQWCIGEICVGCGPLAGSKGYSSCLISGAGHSCLRVCGPAGCGAWECIYPMP